MHTLIRHRRAIRNEKTQKPDMTEGRILGKIVLFILPLIATNLLQMLYSAADMMVVSLSSEENAVGAIGTTNQLITLITNIFIGLAVGANVVVAQRIGARDEEGTSKAVHTALLISVIAGVASMLVGLIFSHPLLILMGAQENLLELATVYTQFYFIGVPFLSITNFLISIFRAKGDTRTPMIVLTCTGLFNVAFNLFFVLAVGLSVEGVAIATAIANFLSASILTWRLSRDGSSCRFSFRKLRIEKKALREVVVNGVPAGIQGALYALSNMLIMSSVLAVNNSLVPSGSGFEPIVKGNSASSSLEGFPYFATNAVYQAAITFSGQHVGAKKYRRVWRVAGCCYFLTTLIAVVMAGVIRIFRQPFLAFYGVVPGAEGSLNAMAYAAADTRMLIMLTMYFLLGWMEVGSGLLRGLGRSFVSTGVSLVGACLFRVVWIMTVFRAYGTLVSIYISYPISWLLTALAHFIFFTVFLTRMIRKQAKEIPPPDGEGLC